jgi:hypothetical protein
MQQINFPARPSLNRSKRFIWLSFAGGISAFAVILPKPMGTGHGVGGGYPDAFHVNGCYAETLDRKTGRPQNDVLWARQETSYASTSWSNNLDPFVFGLVGGSGNPVATNAATPWPLSGTMERGCFAMPSHQADASVVASVN